MFALNYYKKSLLGFRHYAGPCHLAGRTEAVRWPAQGPMAATSLLKYAGAKGSFKRQALPTPDLSFPLLF